MADKDQEPSDAGTDRVGPVGEAATYERDGHVATITYNRPEALNAVNRDLRRDLNAAWKMFMADEEAWVAILTGAGDRAFCAGADLGGGGSAGDFPGTFWEKPTVNSFESGLEVFKPTIAAVNGHCIGYGLTAVVACDFVLASERATFAWPEVTLGIPTIVGAIRLPRRVAWADAMELLLTGETIDAGRAAAMGLVWRISDHDRLMGRRPVAGGPAVQRSPAGGQGHQGGSGQDPDHAVDRSRPLRRDHANGGRHHRRRHRGPPGTCRPSAARMAGPLTQRSDSP